MPGLIDRSKIRALHAAIRGAHTEGVSTVAGLRSRVRRIEGELLEAELGEPAHGLHFVLRADRSHAGGGQGRAPSPLAYVLLGTGF